MAYLGRPGATAPLTTADIPDGIIVASDLAPNSVDSSELVDGSVDNSHLADDAVGTDELANDVVINTSGAITTTGGMTASQTATSGVGVQFTRDLASGSTDSELVLIKQDNTGDDQPALVVQQDGTGEIVKFKDGGTTAWSITNGAEIRHHGVTMLEGWSDPTTGAGIQIGFTGANIGRIQCNNRGTSTNHPIEIGTANQIYLKADGQVGIGTATPSTRVHIRGGTDCFLTVFAQSGTGTHKSGIYFGSDDGSFVTHQAGQIYCANPSNPNATMYFGVYASGLTATHYMNQGVFNGDFNDTSDRGLKDNIAPLESGALELVNALNPVKFNWKVGKCRDSENRKIGFIAQELETIIPEAVIGEDYDPDKADDHSEGHNSGKSMNNNAVVSVLTKAVQELSAKNDALEAENTALKTRMDALEARITALEG